MKKIILAIATFTILSPLAEARDQLTKAEKKWVSDVSRQVFSPEVYELKSVDHDIRQALFTDGNGLLLCKKFVSFNFPLYPKQTSTEVPTQVAAQVLKNTYDSIKSILLKEREGLVIGELENVKSGEVVRNPCFKMIGLPFSTYSSFAINLGVVTKFLSDDSAKVLPGKYENMAAFLSKNHVCGVTSVESTTSPNKNLNIAPASVGLDSEVLIFDSDSKGTSENAK